MQVAYFVPLRMCCQPPDGLDLAKKIECLVLKIGAFGRAFTRLSKFEA